LDSDCGTRDVCIQYNLEKPDAKRYCVEPNNANAVLWQFYQNAKFQGAPVHKSATGIRIGRILLHSGLMIGSGFALVAAIDAAGKSFSGEGELNTTLYLSGFTATIGLVSIATLISNISMQIRHSAYASMGYRPPSSLAAASWVLGTLGLTLYAIGFPLYYASPDDHQWAWILVAFSLACSIVVDQIRPYWNYQLIRSTLKEKKTTVRWYPVLGSVPGNTSRANTLSLGLGGMF
jgi:hypothetical protein